MKRTVLIIALVVFGFSFVAFGQEKISVVEYGQCIRWSPDGNTIAFTAKFQKESNKSDDPFTPKELFASGIGKVNRDGSNFQIIISNQWKEFEGPAKRIKEIPNYPGGYKSQNPSQPPITPLFSEYTLFDWSPSGKKIVFVDAPTELPAEELYIWTINVDGTNLRQLGKTETESSSFPESLQWLRDGRIVFKAGAEYYKNPKNAFDLSAVFYWLNSENSRAEKKISPARTFDNPCFSPDGKKIAYRGRTEIDRKQRKYDIFVFDVATGKEVNLTNVALHTGCESPTWSPDGNRIAFVFNSGRRKPIEDLPEIGLPKVQISSIWTINADGTNSRPVTIISKDEYKKIQDGLKEEYYKKYKKEYKQENYTDNVDLSLIGIMDGYPNWSPDGKSIVFKRMLTREGRPIESGGYLVIIYVDSQKTQIIDGEKNVARILKLGQK